MLEKGYHLIFFLIYNYSCASHTWWELYFNSVSKCLLPEWLPFSQLLFTVSLIRAL